jgi:hypothetical protein
VIFSPPLQTQERLYPGLTAAVALGVRWSFVAAGDASETYR